MGFFSSNLFGRSTSMPRASTGVGVGGSLVSAGQSVFGPVGTPQPQAGSAIDREWADQLIQAQNQALSAIYSGGYGSGGGYGGGGYGGGASPNPDDVKVGAAQAQIDRDAILADRALREHLRQQFEKQQGLSWDQAFENYNRGGRQVKTQAVAAGATTAEGTKNQYGDLHSQLGFALRNIDINQKIREFQDFVAQTQEANQIRKINLEWAPLSAFLGGVSLDDEINKIKQSSY